LLVRALGWAVVWGLIGLVGGYVATVAIGIVLFDIFKVSQREGAAAMGLAFVIGPFVACLVALVAAATAAIVVSRRDRARADGRLPPPHPRGRASRAMIVGLLGGIAGYLVAVALLAVVYALRGSPYFSSYGWAYAAAWTPFMAALVGGGLGVWMVLRGGKPGDDGLNPG
jgi:hypothetical protein